MLISQPVLLPKEVSLLQLPHNRKKIDALWPKLQLMACLLSGRDDIIMESWRTGTTKQYRVYLDKWTNFAKARNESPIHPTVAKVLEFLTPLYDSGSSYSAINTAGSALSAAVYLCDSPYTVGEHPLIKRFIKAAFQSRPPLPRYHTICNVSKVLYLLKTWSPAKKLNSIVLTIKLVMLCLLGHLTKMPVSSLNGH